MFDQDAIDREMERQIAMSNKNHREFKDKSSTEKELRAAVKEVLPRALARMRSTGWPQGCEEWVEPDGLFGRKRQVRMVLLYGEPLSVPLSFNGYELGCLLGEDGKLYSPNVMMWTSPKVGIAPYALADSPYGFSLNYSRLELVLAGLEVLAADSQ